jgi:hypothetical protein
VLLHLIGGAIGSARRKTVNRGNGAVTWNGLLGRGDIVWDALLGLCVRLRDVVGEEAMHGAFSAAFPALYEEEFLANQFNLTRERMLRGEHAHGWEDLTRIVPGIDRYSEDVLRAMRAALGEP